MRMYLDAAPVIYAVERTSRFAVAVQARLSAPGTVLIASDLTRMECRVRSLREANARRLALSLGMEEYRIQRALALYQREAGSLGYVAELLGVPKRVLMEEARRRGVLPQFDEALADQDQG